MRNTGQLPTEMLVVGIQIVVHLQSASNKKTCWQMSRTACEHAVVLRLAVTKAAAC